MRFARSAFVFALLTVTACACAGSDGGAATTQEVFELVRIGAAPVPRPVRPSTCDPAPVAAWYRFRGARWASIDTLAGCNATAGDRTTVVAAGGRFERRGDTLRFYVADTTIGVGGLVDLGWRRGDTLIVRGSDADGGDYTFVRRR